MMCSFIMKKYISSRLPDFYTIQYYSINKPNSPVLYCFPVIVGNRWLWMASTSDATCITERYIKARHSRRPVVDWGKKMSNCSWMSYCSHPWDSPYDITPRKHFSGQINYWEVYSLRNLMLPLRTDAHAWLASVLGWYLEHRYLSERLYCGSRQAYTSGFTAKFNSSIGK